MAHHGVVTVACKSSSVRAVADYFVKLVESAQLLVFARIDHGTNATEAGLDLRPTELIVFGNPKGGTPLMQDNQMAGLDLPFKALVWKDADGTVWLSYNNPAWLAARHDLSEASRPAIAAIEAGMTRLAGAVGQFESA
jgi:uncharacterized protein (DUF302 family)